MFLKSKTENIRFDKGMTTLYLDDGGTKIHLNEDNKKHREGDLPAVERANGDREWWSFGSRNREEDKPAIEHANGDREWWVGGIRHREGDKPAVELANGRKEWWVSGLKHREGGKPAVVRADSDIEHWVKGVRDDPEIWWEDTSSRSITKRCTVS